jgi:hypothetical protein
MSGHDPGNPAGSLFAVLSGGWRRLGDHDQAIAGVNFLDCLLSYSDIAMNAEDCSGDRRSDAKASGRRGTANRPAVKESR